jgi:hypothetical protein
MTVFNLLEARLLQQRDVSSTICVGNVQLEVEGRIDSEECVIAIKPEDIIISARQNDFPNSLKGIVTDFAD